MNNLEVKLFGGVRVLLNGQRVGPFPTRWASGLLAYLALKKGTLFHRDVLAALFWPEEPDKRARKSLRNALWRVRTLIEPDWIEPGTFLAVTGQSIGMRDHESIRLDVAEFDRLAALARVPVASESQARTLEECTRLYQGHFMDGHDHQWCVFERERLRLGLLMVLERLLKFHYRRRDWTLALQLGRMILWHDPFREHVHRVVMVSHYSRGDRPLAIRQYHECVRLLEEEMKLKPMEATEVLYRQIRDDEVAIPSARVISNPLPSDLADVESEFKEAFRRAERALSDLRRLAGLRASPDGPHETGVLAQEPTRDPD